MTEDDDARLARLRKDLAELRERAKELGIGAHDSPTGRSASPGRVDVAEDQLVAGREVADAVGGKAVGGKAVGGKAARGTKAAASATASPSTPAAAPTVGALVGSRRAYSKRAKADSGRAKADSETAKAGAFVAEGSPERDTAETAAAGERTRASGDPAGTAPAGVTGTAEAANSTVVAEPQHTGTAAERHRAATRPAPRPATGGKPPKPPRRNPLRRKRARRPPPRLAVPVPIPVKRRSAWVAAPRWPIVTAVAGLAIAFVMVPVVAGLAFRLWTAMNETSFLLGADPSRAQSLRAAAGVAGGGLTTAIGIWALGIVRGRVSYLAAGFAVLLLFGGFSFMAYTANAGIVSAPVPTLSEMISPDGWDRAEQLAGVFLLACAALALAIIDLLYRSFTAVRQAVSERD